MIHWLLRRWFDRHDPALYTTGFEYRYTGHDEAKAHAARKRRDEHERARRKLADARTQSPSMSVREFPREQTR